MKYSIKDKTQIEMLLGTGLSVFSLCKQANISFEELCEIAEQFGSLKDELKKWYPRYDFEVRVKVSEETDDVSKGQQVTSKPKGKAK